MQFRLVYQGRLPAASRSKTRNREKHEIRRALHGQLIQLWHADAFLNRFFGRHPTVSVETIAARYERCGYKFVPLIGELFGDVACALDILFLRRDRPGDLVHGGGDLDNRMKVLFDALRVPQNCDELPKSRPQDDEDPLFCLLEDDKWITELSITTDRLLASAGEGEHENDVHLIIHVRTLVLSGNNMTAFLT